MPPNTAVTHAAYNRIDAALMEALRFVEQGQFNPPALHELRVPINAAVLETMSRLILNARALWRDARYNRGDVPHIEADLVVPEVPEQADDKRV